MAKSEAGEFKSQLYKGFDLDDLSETRFQELYSEADLLTRKIGAFIIYLNQSNIQGQKFKEHNQP